MTEPELLAGAVTALQTAINPLVHEQLWWDGTAPRRCNPLYTRMRDAQTCATNTCGAPPQASKAPTRMDILAWLCDIDAVVAEYPGSGATLWKLRHLHNKTWTPDDLRIVKAITRNCERWTHQARDILGDNPPQVALREECPLCGKYWVKRTDGTRDYALKATASMNNWHAICAACKTVWYTPAEQANFRRMLGERHDTA